MDTLESLVVRAATTGVETTLEQLLRLRGLPESTVLSSVVMITDYVHSLGLELVPGVDVGELGTIRTLRHPTTMQTRLSAVKRAMGEGESSTVEFKASMYANMKRYRHSGEIHEELDLAGECLKTVSAFMNSSGGELLVGVDDGAKMCNGVSLDLIAKKWDLDGWQLGWENLLNDRFSHPAEVRRHLDYAMLSYGGDSVFHIKVAACRRPVFVRRTSKGAPEFFVRRGPSTHSLGLEDFAEHFAVENQSSALGSPGALS